MIRPKDRNKQTTTKQLQAQDVRRGTEFGIHTQEGATPKRHTNIQVIFNYPKIYDIQKLITNKYKHKHIYIYIYIRIHIADIKTAHA